MPASPFPLLWQSQFLTNICLPVFYRSPERHELQFLHTPLHSYTVLLIKRFPNILLDAVILKYNMHSLCFITLLAGEITEQNRPGPRINREWERNCKWVGHAWKLSKLNWVWKHLPASAVSWTNSFV